jgi:ribonucleoside-diphosphate reductase beta chain
VLASYEHFGSVARSLQWDEAAVDLRADAEALAALEPALRRRVRILLAGFCVGEAAVADHLGPFARLGSPAARDTFEAQLRDEERHARFFARAWDEVVQAPDGPRRVLTRPFLDLFEVRLPAVVRELAAEELPLSEAVGLYHMVLEGGVFTAGQVALLELLDDGGPAGLRRGVELVLRDERWHVGFGTRCLLDGTVPAGLLDRLRDEGARAIAAWGPVVPAPVAAHTRRVLHRRLAVVEAGLRHDDGRLAQAV